MILFWVNFVYNEQNIINLIDDCPILSVYGLFSCKQFYYCEIQPHNAHTFFVFTLFKKYNSFVQQQIS